MVYESSTTEGFCPEQMKHLAASSIRDFMLLMLEKLRIKTERLYTTIWRKRPLNNLSDCEFN